MQAGRQGQRRHLHPRNSVRSFALLAFCAFARGSGKENKPAIVLQAHLDMVPTVAAGKTFNFEKDQLEMFLDNSLLRANGTTLGGDDGSGVAAALAIAEDKTLAHAPLELLFTVDEEVGLEGAIALKEGELLSDRAKYLINVDSETFGEICLSCAGGAQRRLSLPVHRAAVPAGWRRVRLSLSNLVGGHTGLDIHVGRANALKWVSLLLSENSEALADTQYRIISFNGGNAHNAVPSHCDTTFAVPADKITAFVTAMRELFDALAARWKHIETKVPRLTTEVEAEAPKEALTFASSRALCNAIAAIHHGVWTWSDSVETLVETSESLSIAKLGEKLDLTVYARSSHTTALGPVVAHLENIAALFGGICITEGTDMSGWPAEPNSTLARTAVAVFKDVAKKEPSVISMHAGLECGIIMGKFPKNGMEAISVGPTLRNPHTTDEFLDAHSAVQLYQYLCKLVEKLSE
eukprot:TRINITY_DN283_c0_g1_i11.p1 TRINITY_DN283_c0_g1~~TRINITY_DN283_c0_g1_i11.p1  ORF type:complete len:465 (+),score=137.83 TRINITY_DN283_c0_g1_i11:697-2091(+)